MKKKIIFIILLSSILSSACFSQVETTPRRNFNIGISDGIGGSYFFKLIPALDLRYKSINLRIAPQPNAIGGGISYEILPLSRIFKDSYWIASVYGGYGTYTQAVFDSTNKSFPNSKTSYYSIMGMTGVKLYLGSRAYSQLQIGLINTNSKDVLQYNNSKFTSLYLEFSIGINLFRNRPKVKEVGVEEE